MRGAGLRLCEGAETGARGQTWPAQDKQTVENTRRKLRAMAESRKAEENWKASLSMWRGAEEEGWGWRTRRGL